MTFQLITRIIPSLWRSDLDHNDLQLIEETTGRDSIYYALANGQRIRPFPNVHSIDQAKSWFNGFTSLYMR